MIIHNVLDIVLDDDQWVVTVADANNKTDEIYIRMSTNVLTIDDDDVIVEYTK